MGWYLLLGQWKHHPMGGKCWCWGAAGTEFGWKGPDSQLFSLTQKNDTTGQDGSLISGQMGIKMGCIVLLVSYSRLYDRVQDGKQLH